MAGDAVAEDDEIAAALDLVEIVRRRVEGRGREKSSDAGGGGEERCAHQACTSGWPGFFRYWLTMASAA
jgi:hypothetical protein